MAKEGRIEREAIQRDMRGEGEQRLREVENSYDLGSVELHQWKVLKSGEFSFKVDWKMNSQCHRF